MTERAYQLHHDNAPAHSTALVQVFFSGKESHHPGLSAPLQSRFVSLRILDFPRAKIAVERREICECDSHTVYKLRQQRLTAGWLPQRRVTVHGCTVRSPLIGCQVTSRPHDQFSRYSKWPTYIDITVVCALKVVPLLFFVLCVVFGLKGEHTDKRLPKYSKFSFMSPLLISAGT